MPTATDPMAHWTRAVADAWGIDAVLSTRPGEFDLNIAATAADGRRYVLKVMRAECALEFVYFLVQGHEHVASQAPGFPLPRVVKALCGAASVVCDDPGGVPRRLWLLTQLDGAAYARVSPHSTRLIVELGTRVAELDLALASFSHPQLGRAIKWNLRDSGWIGEQLGLIADPARRALVTGILERYTALTPALHREPLVPIHNDLNDYNLLVTHDARGEARLSGVLDFGDMILGPVVAEIAIAAAYVALGQARPVRAVAALVGAYHAVSPLTAAQVELIWPLVRMRLAVSVVNSAMMQRERPDDSYVVVSQAPAWALLEQTATLSPALVSAQLRLACGLDVTDAGARVMRYLNAMRGRCAPVLGRTLEGAPAVALSAVESLVPRDPFAMTAAEARGLGSDASHPWIGRYGEPRLVYTDAAFRTGRHGAADRRTVHLGVDVFMPAGTAVHAPLDGVVEVVEYRDRALDYGGMVILGHVTPEGDRFSSLYGHLAREVTNQLKVAQRITRGETLATLGTAEENGGWSPHLHLQLALITDGMERDWPGVADPDDLALWSGVCPNPAALLNLADDAVKYHPLDEAAIMSARRAHFAANLKLSYAAPCLFVRGWRHHLFDEWGRAYLDGYNNVPHVGHAHPRIHAVASDQLRRINSNTRYLHPAQVAFAEALLAKVPSHFTHVFLVNSGSEANELALRLARAHTGARDMITMDHGYHGNTTGAIDISPYKFNKPGGGGAPEWVQVVPVADPYRGVHRGPDAGAASTSRAYAGPASGPRCTPRYGSATGTTCTHSGAPPPPGVLNL